MIVFKLSWLPYMLIIGGIAVVAEGQPGGLIPIVLGAIWLYFKFSKKKGNSGKSGAANTTPKTQSPTPPKPAPKPEPKPVTEPKPEEPKPVAPKPAGKFCRHCGAKVEPDDIYCVECGQKL